MTGERGKPSSKKGFNLDPGVITKAKGGGYTTNFKKPGLSNPLIVLDKTYLCSVVGKDGGSGDIVVNWDDADLIRRAHKKVIIKKDDQDEKEYMLGEFVMYKLKFNCFDNIKSGNGSLYAEVVTPNSVVEEEKDFTPEHVTQEPKIPDYMQTDPFVATKWPLEIGSYGVGKIKGFEKNNCLIQAFNGAPLLNVKPKDYEEFKRDLQNSKTKIKLSESLPFIITDNAEDKNYKFYAKILI